ncbi:MAG: biotin/lipoate A/B protein ligase family protein [Natrialbaceae archaeon]|nr:biotin/lipoate A/B protein ligase family protein [Natrialbaceae archaeon]
MDNLRWRLIQDTAREGAMQMALEEAAAETARTSNLATVRVYDWSPSAVTMGYNQDQATIDWTYCETEGIDVTRRQTGGGGIYHDATGDIAYTIVAPMEAVPGDLMACYEQFCTPILEALTSLGVEATFAASPQPSLYHPACYLRDVHPAHDIVVDGAKVSGNAQYRQRDVVIQHGSITYEKQLAAGLGVFSTNEITASEYHERVTSVREHADVSRSAVRTALAEALAEWSDATTGSWKETELDRAARLVESKYGRESWILRRQSQPPSP